MKIVLSTNRFLPYSTGGVETLALGLAQVYRSLGHQVSILCAEIDQSLQSETRISHDIISDISVDRVWMNPIGREEAQWTRYDETLLPPLREVMAKRQPDILHALTFGMLSSTLIESAGKVGARTFYTACGYELTCSLIELIQPDGTLCDGEASLRRCLACRRPHTRQSELVYHSVKWLPAWSWPSAAALWERIINRPITLFEMITLLYQRREIMQAAIEQVDKIIAPSNWAKNVLLRNGVSPNKVEVIHHGVQPEVCGLEKRPPTSGLRFGYIGRITPIKGVEILIRAFLRVPGSLCASLTIHGTVSEHDQDYFQTCQALANTCPSIQMGGSLDRTQIAQAFTEIDVLVVPSMWHEVLGIVIQEAFANRTPVIASNIGGIPDLVQHGVNGWLFPPFSEDALTDLLCQCCNDPVLVTTAQKQIGPVRTVQAEAMELLAIYGLAT